MPFDIYHLGISLRQNYAHSSSGDIIAMAFSSSEHSNLDTAHSLKFCSEYMNTHVNHVYSNVNGITKFSVHINRPFGIFLIRLDSFTLKICACKYIY